MEIAIILRDAMLVNGLLTSAEVWYKITEKNSATLKSADLSLFRKIFGMKKKQSPVSWFGTQIRTKKNGLHFDEKWPVGALQWDKTPKALQSTTQSNEKGYFSIVKKNAIGG